MKTIIDLIWIVLATIASILIIRRPLRIIFPPSPADRVIADLKRQDWYARFPWIERVARCFPPVSQRPLGYRELLFRSFLFLLCIAATFIPPIVWH